MVVVVMVVVVMVVVVMVAMVVIIVVIVVVILVVVVISINHIIFPNLIISLTSLNIVTQFNNHSYSLISQYHSFVPSSCSSTEL